jgi:hypothetical protein
VPLAVAAPLAVAVTAVDAAAGRARPAARVPVVRLAASTTAPIFFLVVIVDASLGTAKEIP